MALAAIVRERADGVLFIADPIFFIHLKRMVDLVARLPPVVAMLRSCCDAPDVAMAETALSRINEAFETLRDGGNAPSAEYYERQLLRARAIVARLGAREAGTNALVGKDQ